MTLYERVQESREVFIRFQELISLAFVFSIPAASTVTTRNTSQAATSHQILTRTQRDKQLD